MGMIKEIFSIMNRNDLCWCGSGKKYKKCHMEYDERINEMKFDFFKGQCRPPHKIINNEADIAGIRAAAAINDAALDLMAQMVRPGIDTATLDAAVYDFLSARARAPPTSISRATRRASASPSTTSSATASRRRRRSSRKGTSSIST